MLLTTTSEFHFFSPQSTPPSRNKQCRPSNVSSVASSRRPARWLAWLCMLWLGTGLEQTARATLQFDVFMGYDDNVREGGWFPVACEVFNDGPAFQAVFELSSGQLGSSQTRQVALELPTNTRKRFVIPAFASSRYASWDARLLDSRGKVRAEKTGMRPKDLAWTGILLGAVPRSFGGLPTFPEIKQNRTEMQPRVARMQLEQFPDNPIALEGLSALYVNSEKAIELKANQVAALLAWVHGGGHLIVAVEQPTDVNATPWLRQLLPVDLTGVATRSVNGELQKWLTGAPAEVEPEPSSAIETTQPQILRGRQMSPRMNPQLAQRYGLNAPRSSRPPSSMANPFTTLVADAAFDQAELSVATGSIRDGKAVLSVQGAPLVIAANRGRGQVTALTFSPEREPFRGWKHRAWFWAKLMKIPPAWFASPDVNYYGGMSMDGVFGAMIDSRQVRKLPVEWLLLLLIVYLLVIGPVDQYWLKRIGKQMLTWITFPAYVALFSLLIYFIAAKLRAGETEWNELHLVDILLRGERAELRGRTYSSLYSPVNARYQLTSTNQQSYATLRGEFQGLWNGGQETSKARVEQRGNGYDAEIFVPVWTSQLYVSDWMQPAELPLVATVVSRDGGFQVSVENRLDRILSSARLAVQGRVYELGELPAGKTKAFTLETQKGTGLREFVTQHANDFSRAVQGRQRALGDTQSGRLENGPLGSMAASFVSLMGVPGVNQGGFVYPPGLDLSALVERGDAVLLAWDAAHSLAKPINRFNAVRSQKNTLLRLAIPVGPQAKL